MSKFKRALCAVLCLVMVAGFAACKEDLGEVTYGRYVETDISPEGMKGSPYRVYTNSSGVIDFFTQDYDYENMRSQYYRWRSTDGGESWTQIDTSWTEAYNQPYDENATVITYMGYPMILPSGDAVFTLETYNAEDYSSSGSALKMASLDGTVSDFSLPILEQMKADGAKVNLYDFQPLNNELFYIYAYKEATPEEQANGTWGTDMRAVFNINTNEILYQFDENEWGDWYANEQYLFILDYNAEKVKVINLADGSEASGVAAPTLQQIQQVGYGSGSFVDSENNFYTINTKGVIKISADAQEPETVMEGVNFTFGSPLGYASSLTAGADGSILVTCSYEDDPGKVLKYVYDPEAPIYSNRVLKIYSLYDSNTVRLAISEYRKMYPEIMVTYEYPLTRDDDYTYYGGYGGYGGYGDAGGNGGDAMTEDDALRALNTELLNGGGPDILILDDLPIESYIEKGVLEDLSKYLEDKELYNAAIDALRDDRGRAYAIPARFSVPLIFGEQSELSQYSDFNALVSAIVNGPTPPERIEPDWENMTDEDWNNYYYNMERPLSKEEQPVLSFDSFDDMYNTFYELNAPAIFTESTGLNRENLATFLQAVKSVSDKYNLLGGDSGYSSGVAYSTTMSGIIYRYSATMDRYSNQRSQLGYSLFSSFNPLQNLSYNIYYQQQQQNSDIGKLARASSSSSVVSDVVVMDEEGVEATQPEDEAEPEGGEETEPETTPEQDYYQRSYAYAPMNPDAIPAPGIESGVYYPSVIVGVSTNSKLGEYATGFVEAILSYDVQRGDMNEGLPVLKEAFANMLEKYNRTETTMTEEGFKLVQLDYEAIFNSVTTPYFANSYLKNAISDYIYQYCQGEMSLDDAIAQIVSETELYFAERQ